MVKMAAALALVAAAVPLAGCGGGTSAEPLAQHSISDQVSALREHLVAPREVARMRLGSVDRAFLSYWRAVQYGDAQRAVDTYEDGLRKTIGTQLLVLAIRNASDVYRRQRPRIDEIDVRGKTAVVRYFATTQASGSAVVPLSTTWTRASGVWRIRYHASLDGELRNAAQSRAQINFRPGAQDLDPRAVRAGERAAELQAEYLAAPANADSPEAAAP